VPGFAQVKAAAMAHGALGSSLSGAGRACSRGSRSEAERRAAAPAMQAAFADAGFDSRAYVSPVGRGRARAADDRSARRGAVRRASP
jgi:homoserine kinase